MMGPKTRPRRRRLLASRWAKVLPLLGFEYDYQRSSVSHHAYVLRRVGERHGPVFLVETPRPRG